MSLKMVLEGESLDELNGIELEAVANDEISRFDEFFQQLDENSRLMAPERALIKTYLWYKFRGERKKPVEVLSVSG